MAREIKELLETIDIERNKQYSDEEHDEMVSKLFMEV